MRKEPVDGEVYPIRRSRCSRGHDRGRDLRRARGGAVTGDDPQPSGAGPEADEAAGAGLDAESVLRGGAHGIRTVLAANGTRGEVRGGGADAGAGQNWGPGEDGPARR